MHVSVVIAVYNGAATVGAAIRSVIAQTYRDWELIVINDCSTDSTADVLADLAAEDPRIRVLTNSTNLRAAASRNIGWRVAQGKLIAILDADDACEPQRLARQVEFFTAHPEVDIVGSDAWLMDEHDAIFGRTTSRESHEELVAHMYRETPLLNPTVMARRGVFEETGGFDESLRYAEDCDLWLRTYHKYRMHNLPLPLVRYRVREGMSTPRINCGAYVLLRAAYREGKLLSHGWHSARWLAAMWLTRLGVYHSGPRAIEASAPVPCPAPRS